MKKLIFFFVLLIPVLTFAQALNGNYVIGNANTDVNFKTLTAAVAKINTVGVSGPVTFLLDDANYNVSTGETFPIKINQFAGSSATNTLTIKPNSGKDVTITSQVIFANNNNITSYAVFQIDGADNIVIDGSNTSGTSKNLLIQNSDYLEYTARTAIWISSNGSNAANNITIKNTKLKTQSANSAEKLLSGIFSGSNSLGANGNSMNDPATAVNSNLTFTNNEFINVRQGIVIKGGADALKSQNITISSNIFGSTTDAQKLCSAIIVSNANNVDVVDNIMDGIRKSDIAGSNVLSAIQMENSSNYNIKRNVINNLVTSFDQAAGGILIKGQDVNGVISENKISDVRRTVQGANIIAGIKIESTNTNSNLVIANNFISTISNIGYGEYSSGAYGIHINGNGIKIYHNTVLMNASFVGVSAAVYFNTGSGFDVQNNILVNTNSTVGLKRFAIFSNVTASAFTNINYNNYYAAKIGFLGAEKLTLNDWQSATGKDQFSKNVIPEFVSTTDLHLQSVAANAALDNTGIALSAVPADIDGQLRSSTPDMGADEFSAIPVVTPTTPATVMTISNTTPNIFTLNWSNGNGSNRLVLVRAQNPVNAIPINATTYMANPVFGAGSQLGTGNYVVYSGSGNSATVTGLSSCTKYNVAVYEFNGSGATTQYLTTTPATAVAGESTIYNGSTWSNGLPTSFSVAEITGSIELNENLKACTLLVKNNAQVVVKAGYDVTVEGKLTVESGSSLTFESNTNLVQTDDIENSGNIVVKRESSKLFRLDYTMWGSPVTGAQTLKQFSPETVSTRFYNYNSLTDQFNVIVPTENVFGLGKGYLIRMPDNHTIHGADVTPTSWTGIFTGKPNNGDVSVVLDGSGNGYNMLANPYASMINADEFLTDNSAEIGGTLYFWRRRNAVPDASAYYATYTLAGGTGTAGSASALTQIPNGFIQVGQGFIVKKATAAPITGKALFTNSMRTATNNANQFFKNASSENNGRIWLNVTNAAGEFGQTLVAYLAQADNSVDRTDGKYLNDGSTALTSWLDNSEYIIQGRAHFVSSDVVDLNFKTATAGTYTIAIDHVDGLFEGSQDIFLRDNVLNVLHDLKASSYTFATEAGSFNNRFDLVYQNPLAVDSPTFSSNSVVLFKNQNNIVINSGNSLLERVEVFDIRGRVLAVAKNIQANEISINVGTTNQVLIVKITSADGITVTKKTIN